MGMKIRITKRQLPEDDDTRAFAGLEWTCELDVKDWQDAFEKGREFHLFVDATGQGMNAGHREICGETELDHEV